MGKYKVTAGQNIYDIALHLYGAVEGIVDLMINNNSLSLCDQLKPGDELIYTDGFVIDSDVVAYNRLHKIVPANGDHHVYFKSSGLPAIANLKLKNTETNTGFFISGKGKIEVDWGDNTPIQIITLTKPTQYIHHSFDNHISSVRKVVFYGDINTLYIEQLDFSDLKATAILLLQPVSVGTFKLDENNANIDFVELLYDAYQIELSGQTNSLLPLLKCKNLMSLTLTSKYVSQRLIDEYLISLVHYHYGRRNCSITMPIEPTGEYKEPARDDNNKYILTSGLEAAWVLTNEPAWNEGGYWRINTNNNTYTTEP